MSPPNGCCNWAASCAAPPGPAVIWTLPGVCCTFDPAVPVVAAAVGAAAIATAAAACRHQWDYVIHRDAHCHPLICVGDPRQGGSPLSFRLLASSSARAWWRWGRGPGSRWSARSAARTNDLDAGADPPHTPVGLDEAKSVATQVMWLLL